MGYFQFLSPFEVAARGGNAASASAIQDAYNDLCKSQWLTPTQIKQRQFEQLNRLLHHCGNHVPYYRKLLAEVGLAGREISSMEEFRRIPLLKRAIYQSHFEELTAQNLPDGMRPLKGSLLTSGTSGIPIRVVKANYDMIRWHAFFFRDLEWRGFRQTGRLATIRIFAQDPVDLPKYINGVASSTWSATCKDFFPTGQGFGMDIRQDPRKQLAWLREVKPDYFISVPSNLDFLAQLVKESGERLPDLKAIQIYGEELPEPMRLRIEAGFGVPVGNLYSSTEIGYMASPCPQGHGLHVHTENLIAEVLDRDDRPCQPSESGRLVVTALTSFQLPFIRYDILDDVTLAKGPCPCGRGLPLWTSVEGKSRPPLRLPDGRTVSSMGLVSELQQVPGVYQYQIVQRAPSHVVLRIVPGPAWGTQSAEAMLRVAAVMLGPAICLDIELVEYGQIFTGGKHKSVVIEM